MSTQIYPHIYRTLWLASLPLVPLLLVQGKRVRETALRLPDAEGPNHGRVTAGQGTEVSIAILGESTAAGVGVASQAVGVAAYTAGQLAELRITPVRWQVVGKTGASVGTVGRSLVERLSWPIDAVIVMVGANDTMRLSSEGKWIEGIRWLTTDLRRRGARHVVFASVPPVGMFPALPRPMRDVLGFRAKLLDALLRETIRSLEGASYASTVFPDGREYMAVDGFHPSQRGYMEWAKQLGRHLAALPGLRGPESVATHCVGAAG